MDDWLCPHHGLSSRRSFKFDPARKSRFFKGVSLEISLGYVYNIRLECDVVIASIFVNPTQFAPHEDLTTYPRDLERDIRLLGEGGCDILFAPSRVEELYPSGYKTFVTLNDIENTLEGMSRPGHFRGVATIVTKLFNIVRPTKAYFGQKDGIQCIVVKTLVRDLNFPINVVIGPTVRESDGLAMSSRNVYLSKEERAIAPIIYQALLAGKRAYENGERNASVLIDIAKDVLARQPKITLQYLSVASLDTGEEITSIGIDGALFSVAVKLGTTRLIDNVILEPIK
jgi:pantoate--beta-alanine ligase